MNVPRLSSISSEEICRVLEIGQGGHGRFLPSRVFGSPYFEYSSTMSCSETGESISSRSGSRSTLAVSES